MGTFKFQENEVLIDIAFDLSFKGILRAYQYEAHDEFEQQPDISSDEIDVASQVDTEENTSQEEQPTISVEDKQMLSSLHVILDTLNIDNPLLVQEVKCVIQELRRITLLWDELWLGSLTQLHQEAQRFVGRSTKGYFNL